MKLSPSLALLALTTTTPFANAESAETSEASWHRFATNVNYRLTALLDVNGGGFESVQDDDDDGSDDGSDVTHDGSTSAKSKTPGYSMPIEVLTTYNPTNGEYRQRISYFGGMEVDYNFNGKGFKLIGTPFAPPSSSASDDSNSRGVDPPAADDYDSSNKSDNSHTLCMYVGGNADEKTEYLNFFPTIPQMENYSLRDSLITKESGIPYRIATLESAHGESTPVTKQEQYTMGKNDGMPPDDYFQFHYQEPTGGGGGGAGTPLKWTMLARNQIISAHTENWVLRYVSYDTIEGDEERELWENWFDLQFHKSGCSDVTDGDDDTDGGGGPMHHYSFKMNRLGMFFSSSSSSSSGSSHTPSLLQDAPNDQSDATTTTTTITRDEHFDLFLTQNNKHYSHPQEYIKRKSIHDSNINNIQEWNTLHAGKTAFRPNEFLDMEVHEVMRFRGGRVSTTAAAAAGGGGGAWKKAKNVAEDNTKVDMEEVVEEKDEGVRRNLRQSNLRRLDNNNKSIVVEEAEEDEDDEDDDSGEDDYASKNEFFGFTPYELPSDFDPSTLPQEFDWRTHLPGSVGPIKDQGICGSCWAFSLVSALESHWFIHNSQSVNLPEQYIIDCAWTDYTHACDGGESGVAAKHIVDTFQGRVPTRDVYGGYLSVDGRCYVDILEGLGMFNDDDDNNNNNNNEQDQQQQQQQVSEEVAAASTIQVTDWVTIPPRDDIATKHALMTQGPLSIAFNVVSEAIYYANGVLDVESCEEHDEMHLDHAINLVGWGVDELADGSKAEHWIIRNSWSTRWGDEGYLKVRMGKRDCGVTTTAGFPVVSKVPGVKEINSVEDHGHYTMAVM